MSTRLVIDCDPGHDDALALILAHARAEVVGITTVSGNAPIEAVTRNALKIVELLDVGTPVIRGAEGPLVPPADGRPRHATHVHGPSGLDGTRLPEPKRTIAGDDAAAYLLEVSRRQAGLWLVAIGPLTNVAQAIAQDAGFAARLAGISIMGGSTVGGNVTASAEFNVWADPEAAAVVFGSGANIRMCGLNLTHQLRSNDGLIATLRGGDSARAVFAADVLDFLHQRMLGLIGERAAAMHDPCAVLAVTDAELLDFQARQVSVELNGKLTRGMTVVDERFSADNNANANALVGYAINAPAALRALLDTLA